MATRIAGFVYSLSSGLPASGVTVTPRASDGSSGTTGTTNAGGFVSIAGLPDKTWTGTVANAAQVFVPATMGEGMLVDDLHGQRNTIGAHDFSQLRGKATVGQISSESATATYVLTSDGLGNATWSPSTGGGGNSFATIDCPAGTDPVADSSSDTLTLAAGTGISITGDATADSVTFALNATINDLSDVTIAAAADGDFLKYNGSAWVDFDLFGTSNTWALGQSFSAQLTSTLATGTAPFSIASTTVCTNLNADLLDGSHASAFATSGHTHALDDLSDVTLTTPATGSFLQYNGSAWIDFDLLATANTWALLQTFTSGGTFNSTVLVADTIPVRFSNANMSITGTTASTLLELRSNNSISAGQISLNPRVTLDCQINSASHLTLNSTALLLLTALPMYYGSSSQFIKGTSASALLEISSTNTAGIIRYDAKASHEFRIDSSATTDMTLTADKLAFLHGTYHVGFGWSVDGQLDTIIDNAYVDSFVAAETSFALDGGYGSGIKLLYRGIGINETVEADVGYNYWHYDDLADQRNCDWLIGTGGAGDQYRFFLGSVGVVKISTSPWLTLNDTSLTTKFTIGEDANDDVVIATAGSDNPQIVLQPRGNATMTLQSSSTAAYSMTWSSAVNTIQLTATNSSACSVQIDKSVGGAFSFFVGTGAPTNSKIYLGKAHASSILSFFGATGTAQAANTTDIKDGLIGFGLWAAGTSATPLDLDGGTLTAGKLVSTEWEYAGNMTVDPVSGSNTTVTVENTGSGKCTLRVAPNAVASPADSNYAKVGGILYSFGEITSLASTTTSSEENVLAYTLKAYTFYTAGDTIELRALLSFAANTRVKLIKVKLGSNISVAVMNVATNAADCKALLYARFVRRAGSNMTCSAHIIPTSALATAGAVDTMVYDDTSSDDGASDMTLAISSTIASGQAQDVTINDVTIAWYPGQSA